MPSVLRKSEKTQRFRKTLERIIIITNAKERFLRSVSGLLLLPFFLLPRLRANDVIYIKMT